MARSNHKGLQKWAKFGFYQEDNGEPKVCLLSLPRSDGSVAFVEVPQWQDLVFCRPLPFPSTPISLHLSQQIPLSSFLASLSYQQQKSQPSAQAKGYSFVPSVCPYCSRCLEQPVLSYPPIQSFQGAQGPAQILPPLGRPP